MSIYIKGVEMPKHDDEYVIFTVYGDGGVVYGPLNRPHVRYKDRAVPVPPHGKLGDLDALIKTIAENMEAAKKADNYDWWNACSVAGDFVMDAPTIIPASEEGEL